MKQSVLIKSALLGTNRMGPSLGVPPHSSLQLAWHELDEIFDPAQALLTAAALERTCWHAGPKAEFAELPVRCADETKPYISPATANRAVDLMSNSNELYLKEWVGLVREHGFIATPRLLPNLLQYGESNYEAREALADIVGNRGTWLACRVGKWPWLLAEKKIDDMSWDTGMLFERLDWLRQKIDTNVRDVADIIENSWPNESPDAREAITELVSNTPHAAHETWLQKFALTDRRQSTRQFAIQALMKIDGSAYRERSLKRAAALIRVVKNSSKLDQLQCMPPEQFDTSWTKDSIREKPPVGSGAKAFWMLQILSVVPLQDWNRLTEHETPFCLHLSQDWSDLILQSWCNAGILHSNNSSSGPLIERLSNELKDTSQSINFRRLLETLISNESAEVIEGLSIGKERQIQYLLNCKPLLNAEHHNKLQTCLVDRVFNKTDQLNRNEAVALAVCCASSEINPILKRISKEKELNAAQEEFARALEFRQSYRKHFPDSNALS